MKPLYLLEFFVFILFTYDFLRYQSFTGEIKARFSKLKKNIFKIFKPKCLLVGRRMSAEKMQFRCTPRGTT